MQTFPIVRVLTGMILLSVLGSGCISDPIEPRLFADNESDAILFVYGSIS